MALLCLVAIGSALLPDRLCSILESTLTLTSSMAFDFFGVVGHSLQNLRTHQVNGCSGAAVG